MKKVVVILLVFALGSVGVAYYFSSESLKLIEMKQEGDYLNEVLQENKMIAAESAREELLYGNTMSYQSIDFTKTEYAIINPCLKEFQTSEKLDALCVNEIVDVVVDDFGEEGFIKAVIGSSIDYTNLVFNSTFLDNLFDKNASLANRLTLGFLNRYRNPEQLQQAFNKYKQDIFNNTPKSLYQNVFKNQVEELLSAHEEISGQNNKEAFFEDLYFKADTRYLHGQYWKYTFWKRREIEKNDGVVFTILTEIQHYYQ
ncbi:hypothetical protein [Flagellimonas lutimaris]|uniref:hypothetical protein n=1 Tax=Flagellimonas lutimaris TaxID=475082 RepID=UPI003F5CC07A